MLKNERHHSYYTDAAEQTLIGVCTTSESKKRAWPQVNMCVLLPQLICRIIFTLGILYWKTAIPRFDQLTSFLTSSFLTKATRNIDCTKGATFLHIGYAMALLLFLKLN